MKRAPREHFRAQSGSMLTMTILCIGIMLASCIIGFAFYLLLTEQKRGQNEADQIALQLVNMMNRDDRIGQMNNLIARNRELVYASRSMANWCDNSYMYFCSPLAYQLLDEAAASNIEIERERKNQIVMMQNNVRDYVDQYNLHVNPNARFSLPWWQAYALQITDVDAGSVEGVQSNVVHDEIYEDLNDLDRRAAYVQLKSNLYKGDINAKLPNPDQSLDFKLCSIAAPVEKTVAPARLVNPDSFKYANYIFQNGEFRKETFVQIPSAVRVLGRMMISMRGDKQAVTIGSTALTTGAGPPPTR